VALRDNFFVVIEGLDGSGKTQVSRALKRALQQTLGQNIQLTFEPHDPSTAGLYIRQVLTKRVANVQPRTLALAFALNRADHNDRLIERFLRSEQNRVLICDRYYLSSLVYQSTEDIDMATIRELNQGARKPNLTVFLNASTKTCYERMRKRPDDKELFEKNLEQSRQKYFEAIVYLRSLGETIVEINADGSIAEVVNAILDQIISYGPNWLSIGQRTLLEAADDTFSLNGLDETASQIENVVSRFTGHWSNEGKIQNGVQLEQRLRQLREDVKNEIDRLSYDALGLLFIGYLQRHQYQISERLPWTEMLAYEMLFEMPLAQTQRGTALLLTEATRFDQVTRKIQHLLDGVGDYADLSRLSDFMFILDAAPLKLVESYYERDTSVSAPSPSVRILHRQDIADMVYVDVLTEFYREYSNTLSGTHELKATFFEILDEFGVQHYWSK
jgi:dTMP kinase